LTKSDRVVCLPINLFSSGETNSGNQVGKMQASGGLKQRYYCNSCFHFFVQRKYGRDNRKFTWSL